MHVTMLVRIENIGPDSLLQSSSYSVSNILSARVQRISFDLDKLYSRLKVHIGRAQCQVHILF